MKAPRRLVPSSCVCGGKVIVWRRSRRKSKTTPFAGDDRRHASLPIAGWLNLILDPSLNHSRELRLRLGITPARAGRGCLCILVGLMKTVSHCLVCGEQIQGRRKAAAAPFLARRIWDREPFAVELLECPACHFMFFNPRLDDEEQGKLYAAYRDPQYQQMRQACEPWYTERLNAGLSAPATWKLRKARLEKIFSQHIRQFGIRSVLDFGGARGELIQDLAPAGGAYVYDISSVDPIPGVEKLRSIDECKSRSFDLIVCSNVLEHVAAPREFLAQIAGITSERTLVYMEVPWEAPRSCPVLAKRLLQQALLAVTRPALAFSLMRLGTLNLMHEHVNYFSPATLDRLMASMRWNVLASGAYRISESLLAERMTWSLARPRPE